MSVFAKFYQIPSMILGDNKETIRYGHTVGPVYPPTNTVCGGIITDLCSFEDAIQPLAVEIYMITCLLQKSMLFRRTIYMYDAQYQLFEHNINIYGFACDVPSTNQRTRIKYEK